MWKVVITLYQPLPASEKQIDTAFALVVLENEQWRFERFLTASEGAQFEQEPAQFQLCHEPLMQLLPRHSTAA